MDNHEMGILIFLTLALAIMFLPDRLRLGRTAPPQALQNAKRPKKWQLWIAGLAFLQSCIFVAVGFACEAAGTHWLVGLFCVSGSLLCSANVLWLFGLRPGHLLR